MFVDPLAEDFVGWTPYHYVHQNPINLIDPTGMFAEGPPEGKYAQGHKHTDEQGVSWKLNGSVWENLSGGEDEWEPDTLNEIVIEIDRSTGWKDVARTTAGFTPFLGSGLDIYEGIRDGNGWQVAGGIGGFILDVSTMGVGGVVIKGGAKALLKEAAEQTLKKGWKLGDDITNLTAKGNTPKWSTVRQRFWKNEVHYNEELYNPANYERMKRGLAPQRINPTTGKLESMELHHTVPQREGGLFEFIKVWPDEHKAIDPFRR